eukprot:scaffold30525_cov17-Tisochrysis_lutea.AAC.1
MEEGEGESGEDERERGEKKTRGERETHREKGERHSENKKKRRIYIIVAQGLSRRSAPLPLSLSLSPPHLAINGVPSRGALPALRPLSCSLLAARSAVRRGGVEPPPTRLRDRAARARRAPPKGAVS